MSEIYDVIIIGSGPASLTAAIYTTRGALSTLIIGGEKWGGQLMLTTLIENYPGFPEGVQGPDLMQSMRKQAENLGARFLEKNADKIDITQSPYQVHQEGTVYLAKTIIIATGASTKWLDLPNSWKLIGRGISSCAPCDAPFFKNKKVVVVGGGDAAMEEALVLAKYTDDVTIVHRRDQFKASIAMQQKVLTNKNIKILWNTEVTDVAGETKLEKIVIKNTKDNTTFEMPVDGMFVAIGHKPESDIFKGHIEIDDKGYIVLHDGSRTSVSGVFVAGDVHDWKYKQAITAAGFGCQAGIDVISYLDNLKEATENE